MSYMYSLERALAAWRLSHLLMYEDGPGGVVRWFRVQTGMSYTEDMEPIPHKYNPLWCFWCTSIFVSVGIMLMPKWLVRAMAASGAAVLIEAWRPDDG